MFPGPKVREDFLGIFFQYDGIEPQFPGHKESFFRCYGLCTISINVPQIPLQSCSQDVTSEVSYDYTDAKVPLIRKNWCISIDFNHVSRRGLPLPWSHFQWISNGFKAFCSTKVTLSIGHIQAKNLEGCHILSSPNFIPLGPYLAPTNCQ